MGAPFVHLKKRPEITTANIADLGRKELLQLYNQNRRMYNEWIRRMVVDHHRVDILCEQVLGYQVQPHHRRILQHQYRHPWSQTLVWRGAGKSTVGTVAWCIWLLCMNRNRRILLTSKTAENAHGFLTEIKTQFETNEKLIEIFGNFVGHNRWDNTAIEVLGKNTPTKEPSIMTVGVAGAVASKHFDTIIADDLVDEDNSRTKLQRERMVDWVYKVLVPTLNPPDPADRFVGSFKIQGTRYHYADLYGHLAEKQTDGTGGDMAGDKTLVIPIEKDDGTPEWPERFPASHIAKLRTMGVIRFNSQYRCDCEAMKGQIISYDQCQIIKDDLIPNNLSMYQGVDLAISEDEQADMFAQVVIGVDDKTKRVYVMEYMEAQLTFPKQTASIIDVGKRNNVLRCAIEANAYQKAQIHQVKKDAPWFNAVPVITLKDKVTQAWKLSAQLFEPGLIFFRPGMERLIDHLVLFPNHRYKDLFDALVLAQHAATFKRRKVRKEPKLNHPSPLR